MWDVFVLAESGTFSSLCLTSLTRNVGHFGTCCSESVNGSVEEVVGDDVGGEDVGVGFSKKLMTSLIVSSLSIALRDRT